jgi:hypothetical protein
MRIALALVLLTLSLLWARPARADLAGDFAHFFAVDVARVDEVRGFELPRSVARHGGFTHLIVGRFGTTGQHRQHGAVAMRCNPTACRGTTIYLEVDAELSVWGLVDLAGVNTPLKQGTSPRAYTGTPYVHIPVIGASTKRVVWPALVFETRRRQVRSGDTRLRGRVSGTERRDDIHIVSLRARRDEQLTRVLRATTVDRGFSGAGTSTVYRLKRGKTKGALDLIATEQRHLEDESLCMPPKPTEVRLVMKSGRYQRASALDLPRGCH